jgi:transposase
MIDEWEPVGQIPLDTVRVAHAAFPKGCVAMFLRDHLYGIYRNHDFAALFSARGQPALAPWRLALICILQFIDDLSDRQAADAVRSRIDWKYALGLELTDPGFDFSVLSEFRTRLVTEDAAELLLNRLLDQLRTQDYLPDRAPQRTDSTHVLAALRTLNRLECVAETVRQALDSLAVVAPTWLRAQIPPPWFERYSTRVEDYRLPTDAATRQALAETIGADGRHLLQAVYAPTTPAWLREVPAVEILRQVWLQQYYAPAAGQVCWRSAADLPPALTLIQSPHAAEARFGRKRTTAWTGYKVHVTETCAPDAPHLITQVATTVAPVDDGTMLAPIQQALADRGLVPDQQLVDTAYVDAATLVASQTTHGVALVGPVRPDTSWQAQTADGLTQEHFAIDWAAQQVVCPQGQVSQRWREDRSPTGTPVIEVSFSSQHCRACPLQARCTKSPQRGRCLTFQPQAQQAALQAARAHQTTDAFKAAYAARAGVEGTLSQGVRSFGLRRARYVGQAKTHLQHVVTAVAINVVRLAAWVRGTPHARTRQSRFALLAALGPPEYQVGVA